MSETCLSVTILGVPYADCVLVRPAGADPGIDRAVERFLACMKEASGAVIPVLTPGGPLPEGRVVISVGEAPDAPLGEEGYAICARGKTLSLTGGGTRGIIYALYAFLERVVGWRFLSATARFLKRDRAVTVEDGFTLSSEPGFMARDSYWYDSLKNADQTVALYQNAAIGRDLSRHGGGVRYGGPFVHSLPTLAETSREIGAQPCLTDERVFETVRKNVRALLEADPTVSIISVSQQDSFDWQKGCECERCRAIDEREGTPMGSLLTFVNRIADDIREDYPHVWIDTLAYRYTRKPPKTIRPVKNVLIRLCSIECCFAHPIDDPSCPNNAAFREDIRKWSEIADNLFIWDYCTNFAFYLSPFPNIAVLRDDMRFFKEHHAAGMFEEGNYNSVSGELGELRSYLLSHLMWDPMMDKGTYDRLIDGFLEGYYGAGWRYIRTYIDRICAIAARGHITIYSRPRDMIPPVNEDGSANPGLYDELLDLWNKAYDAAETDETRARVDKDRLSAAYLRLCGDDSPERQADRDALLDGLRRHGITHVREGGALSASPDTTKDPMSWV